MNGFVCNINFVHNGDQNLYRNSFYKLVSVQLIIFSDRNSTYKHILC